MNLAPLLAQAAPGGLAGIINTFALPAMIFLIFYVVWFLPIRRRQKELEQLVANLERGDRVVTNGGIFGKVVRAEGPNVVLEVADNVKIRVRRAAIAGLEEPTEKKGS